MRRRILEAIGVTDLPEIPTHDQNDACVSAVLAAAADNKVMGIHALRVGAALSIDSGRVMREGPMMMIPQLEPVLMDRIRQAIVTVDANFAKAIRVAQSASSSQHKTQTNS